MFSLRNNCKLDILTSLPVVMTILAKHIYIHGKQRNYQSNPRIYVEQNAHEL